MHEPELSFAFEFRVDVGPIVSIDDTEGAERGFTPIIGGTVEGPRLRGTVLPGGGDWWVRRSPDTIALEAHYLVQAEDGAAIDVVNRGYYRTETPELLEHLMEKGEKVDPARLYYRTSPVFRAGHPAHEWLAENVFVGMAREEAGQVCIRFYLVA
jgi:hypothetical protein